MSTSKKVTDKPPYDYYCDGLEQNYAIHLSIDIVSLIAIILFVIHFLIVSHRFKKFKQTNSHSTPKNKRNAKKRRDDKLQKDVTLCAFILLCYTISMIIKLMNHLMCKINPTFSTITGLMWGVSYSTSLAGTLMLFSHRLKHVFYGTSYQPSNILYRILMSSGIIFIFCAIIVSILFLVGFSNGGQSNTAKNIVVSSLWFMFVAYIVIIIITVTLFVSTLKKVKCDINCKYTLY